MKRVLFIMGTRPEVIKLAPVVMESRRRARFESIVCVTGQHRLLLDQSLEFFDIEPAFDLDVMRDEQSLFDITASILTKLKDVITETAPEIIVVQGDTTTAMAGALGAYYSRITLAHVEAGLRTGSKYHPFPEEMNRVIVDAIADLCFAPTVSAEQNLLNEGIGQDRITVTGNTVVDALAYTLEIVKSGASAGGQAPKGLRDRITPALRDRLEEPGVKMLLVTTHRRESFGDHLESICLALREIARRHRDVEIVFPVHPNPVVRRACADILEGEERVRLLEPMEYEVFVWLLDHSYFVLTDSGGLQEEAPVLGKPLLVMRESTERLEGIAEGYSVLVGVEKSGIVEAAERLLESPENHARASRHGSPYGDGQAAVRIVDRLEEWLTARE